MTGDYRFFGGIHSGRSIKIINFEMEAAAYLFKASRHGQFHGLGFFYSSHLGIILKEPFVCEKK